MVWHYIDGLGACGLGLWFLWLAWRSLRTGMPLGNPDMNPRRAERPIPFWAIMLLYAAMAAWQLTRGIARIVALA